MNLLPARPIARALCVLAAVLAPSGPASAQAQHRVPDLPFETYTLDNGLEILLHRDTTIPTVHVELWYKVGSKDEEPGRTGFAHLFEHIMFQGTKHIPEDAHFKYLSEAGASAKNGSTSNDRTNYFETLPSNQLELGLWLESSRMGYLLERSSFKQTLDNQREVVKNERRQSVENAPMGAVWKVQIEALFPVGHPYHHEVIGSMDDLTAASEADIRAFFNRYYAPNNAVLFVGGDFDPDQARSLIAKYFGPILAGPPALRRPFPSTEKMLNGEKRIPMEAKINLPTESITWHTMAAFAEGEAELDILASILTAGKTSRLHRRLVHEMKIAQNISAYQWGLQNAGLFEISVSPLPGHTLEEVEKVINEEMTRITQEPVTEAELTRVKNKLRTQFVSNLETIQGRATQLLTYHTYLGNAGYIARDMGRYEDVTADSLRRVAHRWLSTPNRLVVTIDANPNAPIMGRIKQ
ncbi:MAG: pitrilysin family protein [Deltaproteobacteria bacterium]|mgnify:CR=1 FL=1|nr:pitrilysin family protein [Deltaproteobacteria bacterium]